MWLVPVLVTLALLCGVLSFAVLGYTLARAYMCHLEKVERAKANSKSRDKSSNSE